MSELIKITELKNPTTSLKEEFLKFYNAGFPKSQWSAKKLNTFFSKGKKGVCFIIKKDGNIKGLVIGKIFEKNKHSMNLSALFVSDELRGMGYAKKLVKMFVEKTFKDTLIERIELHFRDSNNLQSFYEKFEFGHHEIIGAYKNGDQKHYMEISRGDIIK